MTFISEALYNSLKKEQENLLSQISKLTDQSASLASRIKSDEAFLASYDSTTAKLQASIENAEAQKPVLEKRVEDTKELEAKSKADLEKQNEDLTKLKEQLDAAIKEGEPKSVIDNLNASINIVEGKISDLQKIIDNCKSQVQSLKDQLRDIDDIITVSNSQLADNAAKKEDLESGGLDDAKATLETINEQLIDVNNVYSEFIDKNQATINAFETQDERRNKLIQLSSNRKIYNRALPEADNNVIANEDEVLKEVVKLDLDIDNLSDEEEALLEKALEEAKKESFDPNFLSAEQASDMARTANFSLLPVSQAIKAAAMKGLYSIIVANLSDSNIYALEQSGYTVILTPNRLPEFEVRWDKINAITN